MKFGIALAIGLMSATSFAAVVETPVVYSDAADITASATQIKLTDARYFEVATKVETYEIPGCREYGEASRDCTGINVLERTPVIQANVSYVDPTFSGQSQDKVVNLNFNLPVSSFDAEAVAALKAKRSIFGVQSYSKAFAAKHLSLSVEKATRVISVVDVSNSKLCPSTESSYPNPIPGCVEVIRYKNANTTVKALKISLK